MFINSPRTDRGKEKNDPSTGDDEEDNLSKSTTRSSTVSKKAIADDNGNIVTNLPRTTRVTRSTKSTPVVETPSRVNTRRGDRSDKHKKGEKEDVDESSEESETESVEIKDNTDKKSKEVFDKISKKSCDMTVNDVLEKGKDVSPSDDQSLSSDELQAQENINVKIDDIDNIPEDSSSDDDCKVNNQINDSTEKITTKGDKKPKEIVNENSKESCDSDESADINVVDMSPCDDKASSLDEFKGDEDVDVMLDNTDNIPEDSSSDDDQIDDKTEKKTTKSDDTVTVVMVYKSKENEEMKEMTKDKENSGEKDNDNCSGKNAGSVDEFHSDKDEVIDGDQGQLQIVEESDDDNDEEEDKEDEDTNENSVESSMDVEEGNSQGRVTTNKSTGNSTGKRTCQFCSAVKKSPADLQRHLRKHTGERPFKCQSCSRLFKAKRSLQYHQFMHHGIKSENSNISQKYSQMRKRKLEMDQLRAELCTPDGSKRFKGDDSPDTTMMDGMVRQEGKDSSTSPESGTEMECQSDRTCRVCGKLCLKPSDLKRHMMCHTGERPFKCDICQKPFRAKNSMLYHKKAAHGVNIELSPGLEERFNRLKKQNNLNLLAMKMTHSSDSPKDPVSNRLEDDMDGIESDESSSLNMDMPVIDRSKKTFYSCGYTSTFLDEDVELDESTGLFKHRMKDNEHCVMNSAQSEPPDITQVMKDGSNMVGSEIIQGSHFVKNKISIRNETVLITRLDGFNQTTGEDTSLYKCYLCGKVFNYLSKVQCHLSMHFEKDIVIYQCEICKASFWFKNQVMQHIRRKHPSEVNRSNCASEKRSPDDLKSTDADNDTSNSDMDSGIQVRSEGNEENSDEREDSVSPGKKKLNDEDIFRTEQLEENGNLCRFWRGLKYRKNSNGSYVCLVCRKSFHREISLLKHIKIHSGHKHCYCQDCGKGFTEYAALKQHLVLFHGHVETTRQIKPHIKATTKHTLLSNLLSKKTTEQQQQDSPTYSKPSQEQQAREILMKEGIQEDVTVVMPCGPEDDPDEDVSHLSVLDVWSEHDSEESNGASSQDGQTVTPSFITRLTQVKETSSKSKRKSSQPVKLQKNSQVEKTTPSAVPLQVKIPVSAPSGVNHVTLEKNESSAVQGQGQSPDNVEIKQEPYVKIKQEPLSPKADGTPTSTANIIAANPQVAQFLMAASGTGLNSVLLANTSGNSTSGQPQPMMLLSNHAFPSPIPGGIIGMVQVANTSNQVAAKGPVPSDSSTPVTKENSSNNKTGSGERESLVGFPRVQWSSSDSTPTSSPGPSSNFAWSHISSDGRKVTSLSRTHSRLPIVNAPVNRDKICKPMTLSDGRVVYRCPFCSKDFLSYSDINRHMDFHEDIRPYKCKYCDYYARTNSQLKVHMMRHQGIREFCCKVCNYKGVTQSDLNRHMKSQIHILKSRNECSHCGEGFVTHKNLEKHLDGNCIVKVQKIGDSSDF